ncbi:protein Flattop [Genypterus blacodes]|uniref:protein Flattop n=1 Tax=Genypterus blacodes TaxID=154954 RepID=UPI003F76F3BF
MSSSYSANQYDDAFKPHRMRNWCVAKQRNKRPTAREGHTTIIADNRGHLLPGVSKSKSGWPDFKSTWDLPAHLPVPTCSINRTARSEHGLNRMKAWGLDPKHTPTSRPRSGSTNPDRPQVVGEQDNEGVQQDGAALPSMPPSSPSPSEAAVPLPQGRPITGGGGPSRQDMEEARASPCQRHSRHSSHSGRCGHCRH